MRLAVLFEQSLIHLPFEEVLVINGEEYTESEEGQEPSDTRKSHQESVGVPMVQGDYRADVGIQIYSRGF